MCYRGGPRCDEDVCARIEIAKNHLNRIAERREELAAQDQAIRDGFEVRTEKGGKRTIEGVNSERLRLLDKRKRAQEHLDKLQAEQERTPAGIQSLIDAGENAKAAQRQAERDAVLELNNKSKHASKRLERIMLADGFDPATIDHCNVLAGGSKNVGKAETYLKSRDLAVEKYRELEQQRAAELDAAKTDAKRASIEKKYASRMEARLKRRYEAEHDYFVTPEGLAELQAQADDPSLTAIQRIKHQITHDRYAGIHKERVNDAALRQKRRDRITTAYKKVGKDPKRALNAHKIGGKHDATFSPERLRKNVSLDVCASASDYKRVMAIYQASGFNGSFREYVEHTVATPPSRDFKNVSLATLNAGVKQVPDAHNRMRTEHQGELRNERISIKWSPIARDTTKAGAASFGTTTSSFVLKRLLHEDVRQHSNDRSIIVNEERTAKVLKMMKSGKIPA